MKEKDLNFEDKLWKGADKLRKKIEVHEYKYVILGLIFLRYLSFSFEEKKRKIIGEKPETSRTCSISSFVHVSNVIKCLFLKSIIKPPV